MLMLFIAKTGLGFGDSESASRPLRPQGGALRTESRSFFMRYGRERYSFFEMKIGFRGKNGETKTFFKSQKIFFPKYTPHQSSSTRAQPQHTPTKSIAADRGKNAEYVASCPGQHSPLLAAHPLVQRSAEARSGAYFGYLCKSINFYSLTRARQSAQKIPIQGCKVCAT